MSLKKRFWSYAVKVLLAVMVWLLYMALIPLPQSVPILEYHMVNTTSTEVYNVPPQELEEQLAYLEQEGYTTISMLDFLRARKGKQQLPDKPVILTFDDGYIDNYTTLLPILEKHGMKATVFIITNDIGLEGYLSWDQLRDMQTRGIEIGSHTANHQPLANMDEAQADDELRLSKLLLEWNGIRTVYAFSYPNGSYSSETPELLQKNEYLAAVTGDAGLNSFKTDSYLLQRINIPRPHFGLWEFRLRLLKAQLCTRLGIHQHISE